MYIACIRTVCVYVHCVYIYSVCICTVCVYVHCVYMYSVCICTVCTNTIILLLSVCDHICQHGNHHSNTELGDTRNEQWLDEDMLDGAPVDVPGSDVGEYEPHLE